MDSTFLLGFGAVLVAAVCFGSTPLPIKRFETGDGMFFQWVACTAIWICGFIADAVLGFPKFEPLAMIGGALWCTGNACVVPIIHCIGLGMGIVLWGMGNLLLGWASGYFGLFGVIAQPPPNKALNLVGVGLAVVSTVAFTFVKPAVAEGSDNDNDNDDDDEDDDGTASSAAAVTTTTTVSTDAATPLLRPTASVNDTDDGEDSARTGNSGGAPSAPSGTPEWVGKLSVMQRRIVGVTLSLTSGFCYGVSFDPAQHLADTCDTCSDNLSDYIFSQFTGIFLMSTLILAVYSIIKRNKPDVYPSAILPGLAYGAMWAIADIAWFIANQNLDLVIAFPLVTTLPGVVGGLWGILVFKEIRGLRNLLVWGGAVAVTAVSVTLIALSKL